MLNLTPLILLLPLVGFVVLGLFGRQMPKGAVALIACGLVLASFVAAVVDFFALLGQPVSQRVGDATIWTWVTSGSLTIKFGLLSDPLSAIMLLIVTGVGFLIHVYSVGYMADDASYWRFFSFLNLFEFAMILLVAADNFLFLLIGWGGVGLASFLLIGFWYTRPSAVAAAKKAFVVNVIGDFGLMLAIFLLFQNFGSLAYGDILSKPIVAAMSGATPATPVIAGSTLTAIALLLFLAAAAKSAQLPLHVWLPDAMEGPTPVSALIHAATMVTAGVYLVARAAPLFTVAPNALGVIGGVTGLTALVAATIACVQKDIKRVLAYSTMSQIGYMFMGESAGGFSTGIFHLTTHAYFKALLFMCAGAVIHALGGEQDMSKMGGLRRKLPLTFWTFVIGGLALAAIVPFAGFWSKDAILGILLAKATANGGQLGWWLLYGSGLLTAILTGFYTFRLIFGIFLHEYRGPEIAAAHATHETAQRHARGAASQRGATRRDPLANVHEVGAAMAIPMVILAALSVVGGFYGTPWHNAIGDFLSPVTGRSPEVSPSNGLFWIGIAAGLVAGLLGIAIAWARYGRSQPSFTGKGSPVIRLLENRYYIDAFYDRAIVRPIVGLGLLLRRGVEGVALDGGSRAVGSVVGWSSRVLRGVQTGYARTYALGIFLGAAAIVLYFVAHR